MVIQISIGETMKVMVCECSPYLRALEGLRKVLRQIYCREVPYLELEAAEAKIDIPGLEPVYDEMSLEHKLDRMNSGSRFIRHVRKFSRLMGVRFESLGWNLFLFRDVQGNKILVGRMPSDNWIVVALAGPAEEGFIGMMQERQSDFVNIEEIVVEDLFEGDPYAAQDRADLAAIQYILAA